MSPLDERKELALNLSSFLIDYSKILKDTYYLMNLGRLEEGRQNLVWIVDNFSWLFQGVTLLGKVVAPEEKGIAIVLKELSDAMDNSDNVLTADILEYGVMPIVERWTDSITAAQN